MVDLRLDSILELGHAFNPRRNMLSNDVRSAVVALFEDLAEKKVDYLLVGGVALLSFVEGRNTQDVDLLIDPGDADRIEWNATLLDRDFGKGSYRGIDVDLLLTSNPLFLEVWRNERTRVQFGQVEIPSATREGLLLLKLYALPSLYRQQKLARAALYETDILMLHQGVTIDDTKLVQRLEPFLAQADVRELGNILAEQRARSRFQKH